MTEYTYPLVRRMIILAAVSFRCPVELPADDVRMTSRSVWRCPPGSSVLERAHGQAIALAPAKVVWARLAHPVCRAFDMPKMSAESGILAGQSTQAYRQLTVPLTATDLTIQLKIENGIGVPYIQCAGNEWDVPPEMRKPRVELTPLERVVLLWMSRGKSVTDIGLILNMSPKAVRYHLTKARDRYGYATAIQTVVRAAQDYGFNPAGTEAGDADTTVRAG